MSNFEFMNYIQTPGEKHLGVLTIKAYGKILLRYKVVPKDTGGWFIAPASYKMPGEQYVQAFVLDSNFDKEEIDQLARQHVRQTLSTPSHNPTPFVERPEFQNAPDGVPF